MEAWQSVADELKRLWDLPQLDAQTLAKSAPAVVEGFGLGDPDAALDNLDLLLNQFIEDKHIGSLAAALARHPDVPAGNVQQRLVHFGLYLTEPERDERSVRRYANKGAELLARRLFTAGDPYQARPYIELKITEDNGAIYATVTLEVLDDYAVSVRVQHEDNGYILSVVEEGEEQVQLPLDTTGEDGLLLVRLWWLAEVAPDVRVTMDGAELVEVDTDPAFLAVRIRPVAGMA